MTELETGIIEALVMMKKTTHRIIKGLRHFDLETLDARELKGIHQFIHALEYLEEAKYIQNYTIKNARRTVENLRKIRAFKKNIPSSIEGFEKLFEEDSP